MSLMRTTSSLDRLVNQGVRLISVDVFDTLLYRTSKPELQRFYEISVLQLACVSGATKASVSAIDLFNLRLQAARTVYSTKALRFGAREAAWHEIFQLMLRSLDMSEADQAPVLAECEQLELKYESGHLTLNETLAAALEKARRQSIKIVCVSDMYLNSVQISRLIGLVAGRDLGFTVYSSADFGYGKSCGQLFRKLAADHDIELSQMSHFGDNIWGDYTVPASIGLQAFHTPRPMTWRLAHRLRRWKFTRASVFRG